MMFNFWWKTCKTPCSDEAAKWEWFFRLCEDSIEAGSSLYLTLSEVKLAKEDLSELLAILEKCKKLQASVEDKDEFISSLYSRANNLQLMHDSLLRVLVNERERNTP